MHVDILIKSRLYTGYCVDLYDQRITQKVFIHEYTSWQRLNTECHIKTYIYRRTDALDKMFYPFK